VLGEFLGDDTLREEFWQKAKTNLQAGKVRLVFVADEIPNELRRVVEFLNQQMDPAEVLAVEVKQYTNRGLKALVPRVIGQTAEAQRKKSSTGRVNRQWDESSLMQELQRQRGTVEVDTAKAILEWANGQMPRMWWGSGSLNGSVYPVLDHKGIGYSLFGIFTDGNISLSFQPLRGRPPFNDDSKRLQLLRRFNEIAGVNLPDDAIDRYPSIPLSALKDKLALKKFLDILDWFVHEIKTEAI